MASGCIEEKTSTIPFPVRSVAGLSEAGMDIVISKPAHSGVRDPGYRGKSNPSGDES
jgi:hypothetical protein